MGAYAVPVLRGRPWISRSLPFVCYIAFLVAGDWVAQFLPDPRWVYGLQISAVVLLLILFFREYLELLRPPLTVPFEWGLSIATGAAVFILWINLDQPGLTIGDSEGDSAGFDPRTAQGRLDWSLALVRLFGAAIVVPVMEELFWRSFIMRWLDRSDFLQVDARRVGWKSLLLSSVVFEFEHSLWFAGILAGLAYGWLYRRSGNLWCPIAAHAVTNLLLGVWVLSTGNWQFW